MFVKNDASNGDKKHFLMPQYEKNKKRNTANHWKYSVSLSSLGGHP